MYQDNFSARSLTQSAPVMTTRWSRYEDKMFEQALVLFSEDLPDRWQQIADHVGKSASEVEDHYEVLLRDVAEIDSGRVELPNYPDDSFGTSWDSAAADPSGQISFGGGGKSCKGDAERKKGTPWTEEEHRYILLWILIFVLLFCFSVIGC